VNNFENKPFQHVNEEELPLDRNLIRPTNSSDEEDTLIASLTTNITTYRTTEKPSLTSLWKTICSRRRGKNTRCLPLSSVCRSHGVSLLAQEWSGIEGGCWRHRSPDWIVDRHPARLSPARQTRHTCRWWHKTQGDLGTLDRNWDPEGPRHPLVRVQSRSIPWGYFNVSRMSNLLYKVELDDRLGQQPPQTFSSNAATSTVLSSTFWALNGHLMNPWLIMMDFIYL